MRAFILVMLAFAGLSGCMERPTGVTQLPLEFGMSGDAVSVRARIEGRGPMRQGHTLPVRIAVTNVSDGPVILAHVTVNVGNTSASNDWRPRVMGSVTYDESEDVYRLNQVAQMEAAAAEWSNGLLLPGEATECSLPVQVMEGGALRSGCTLAYYAGTFEDVAPRIYLERQREGVNVIYARATPEGLRALAGKEEPFWRMVIHRPQSEPLMVETQATLHVAAAPLSFQEAMARANLWTEKFGYSEKEDGWVLEGPEEVVLVTPTAVKRYPGCTLWVWEHIERTPQDQDVYFWYLEDDKALHALLRQYDLQAGKVEAGKGFHAYVLRDEALEVIEKAHQAGYLSRLSQFQFTPCVSFGPVTEKPSD